MFRFRFLFLASTLLSSPVLAQDGAAHPHDSDPDHGGADTIIVSADYLDNLDVVTGQSVLRGDVLVRDGRGQIGDTLIRQPGVSATSFAPGASRPVLRGFQGERIRVLTDGLGSLDVSNTSADHGVTIDPLTAERIEILRGPAVLLYGGQAIGGAVNVIDRRIPRTVPEGGVHLDAQAGFGSAAEDLSLGAAGDVALGGGLVAHLDGSYRHSEDQRVGGFVLSEGLRAAQLEIAEEETEEGHLDEAEEALELAQLSGRVPNSAAESYTIGGGLVWIGEGASFGISAGYYDSLYGVPARPGAEHHHEEEGEGAATLLVAEEAHGEEAVSIGMQQWRGDLRGEIETGGGLFESVRIRAGIADYEHTEFEGDEIGTVFLSEAAEGRIELVQADRNGWRGVVGVQGFTRDFEAIGAEAFVPPNETTQFGLFTLQEWDIGALEVELAARVEHTDVNTDALRTAIDEDAPVIAVDRSFDAFSGAVSLSYSLSPDMIVGLSASRATRAPATEELFANGPHIATQAYELGNPNFDLEKSWGLEGSLRGGSGPVNFRLSAYAQWFEDYIYEVATGAEADGLPVFAFQQADARYIGFEGELVARLIDSGGYRLDADLVADYVDAEITDGGGAVPRIPPLRLLGGLDADNGTFGGRVEVEHSFAQDDVAGFETTTPAFSLVNASLSWHPLGAQNETLLVLSANNIFDVTARRHASFTKDFVPLAGRDVRVTLRLSL